MAASKRTRSAWIYGLLAVGPICFVAIQACLWVRNIPNWDEFDSALDFLLALDAGAHGSELLKRFFAVTNEHRTLTSRLMFAVSYWISDGINFAVLAHMGNLFLVGAFGVVLANARSGMPRLRMAAIFALVVFQLQHHENLFWSGASIDHFFVVLAAVGTLAAVLSSAWWALPVAAVSALLATFSLAHGLLTWPVGLTLLAAERRWRDCGLWIAAAAGSCALYFAGFHFNAGHQLPGAADLPQVAVFWLRLAGASPALDSVTAAPWLGLLLVASTALVLLRPVRPRERLPLAIVVWCLGSMAMIAWGRALLSGEWAPITSRYMILSSMAWALLIWVVLERALATHRAPSWCVAAVLSALAIFNVRANIAHLASGRVFAQNVERAVLAFHRDGTFANADTSLYPDPERADALVRAAEERDIFTLPEADELTLARIERIALLGASETDDLQYFIEDCEQTGGEIHIRGWAFRPDETARAGDIYVVFRSDEATYAFEAIPRLRPDVADAYQRPDVVYSGFELRLSASNLPAGEFGVGVCFDGLGAPEYMMTANRVVITTATPADTMAGHTSR